MTANLARTIFRAMESNSMRDTMGGFRLASVGLITAAALTLAAKDISAEGIAGRAGIKEGPYAAPLGWTGFYVGAAVGYGFDTDRLDAGGERFDFSLTGTQGVLSAGYDFQLSPRIVVGVFGDYGFGELDGFSENIKFTVEEQWAIGARLGVLATPSTLLYASGGYTQAEFAFSDSDENTSKTLDGVFVGLGVEQTINRGLSLRLDYRFSSYEDVEVGEFIHDNDTHSVRLGLSWRFGRDHPAQIK
jgi:outer membrane immunogenic protein